MANLTQNFQIDFCKMTRVSNGKGGSILLEFESPAQLKEWKRSERALRRLKREKEERDLRVQDETDRKANSRWWEERNEKLIKEEEEKAKKLMARAIAHYFENVELTEDGVQTRQKDSTSWGVIVPQAITNARWWNEGVSLFNSSAELQVELDKKDKILVHLDSQSTSLKEELGYPKQGRKDIKAYMAAKSELESRIDEKLKEAQGETFEHGQVVFKAFGAILKQKRYNQPVKLMSWSFADAPFDLGGIEVEVKFNLELSSPWKKLRGYGMKATLVPDNLFNLELEGGVSKDDWVVLHSMSGLKGKPLDLVAFAHEIGGADLNIRTGVIVPRSGPAKGKSFDLTKCDTVVDKWRNNKVQKVLASFDYSKSEWEFVRKVDIAEGVYGDGPGSDGYDVEKVVELDEDTVRITAWIEVLVAEMPLNIEVSLPEEGSGVTQLTPEMISVLTLQNRIMGEAMVKLGEDKRRSIVQILKMYKGKAPKGAPRLEIQKDEFLDSIQDLVKDGMNDRQVLRAYQKRFPKGVVFVTRNESLMAQYLDFEAVQGIATFIGGSGDGVTHTIAEFLRKLPSWKNVPGRDSAMHAEFALVGKSSKAWFISQLEAKSLRKKLVSGLKGTAFGSKVRTIAIPELTHEGEAPNCLPKVAVNPKDDLLKDLATSPFTGKIPQRFLNEEGLFDPYLLNGEYVTVFRTPMPMHGACELVITEKVGVGHLALLMHVWALFNEGDSDGDGIGIIPAFHYLDHGEVPLREQYNMMVSMNTHAMGMGGYLMCYGTEVKGWPCAEFCSAKDAWSKKKLFIEPGSDVEQKLVKKGILPYIRKVDVINWIDTVGDVSDHYRNAVSASYNISVIAINQTLSLQYQVWDGGLNAEDLEKRQRALDLSLKFSAVSWRLLYEGLGLAGFSPDAARWFQLFRLSASFTHFVEGPFGPKPVTSKVKKGEAKLISRELMFLGKDAGEGFDKSLGADSTMVAHMLVKASVILKDITTLEKPNSNKKRYAQILADKARFELAVVRRTQRLCSQGQDQALVQMLDSKTEGFEDSFEDDGSNGPDSQSLMSIFTQGKLWERIRCNWQANLLQVASLFTVASLPLVKAAKDAAKEQEDGNQF